MGRILVNTVVSYLVFVGIENTVEGIRRWYHNRKEQKSQVNTENN